jgi:two-component system LytT family response regulator/two-component system response regulator LytT
MEGTPLRTLVVDDEKLARDRLSGFLAGVPGVEVVGEAGDGVEAVSRIQSERPDLVFLDVQRPGMDGFEVLKALPDVPPFVVFATAYDEYAIRAFEVQAVDYLLKPFARTRVEDAVRRVQARRGAGTAARLDLEALARLVAERVPSVRLSQVSVHAGKRILLLPIEEIRWFGVEHRLVYAHNGERGYMTNYTLRELEERLDPEVFFRAHKASLVNLQHVKEIVPWFGGRYKLVMRDAEASEVPVSRSAARILRAKLRW